MSLAKLQNVRTIYKNQLCFYIVTVNKQMILRKQCYLQ